MPDAKHRVVLTFDDGVYAKLICPDDGSCTPATTCASCGRDIRDSEGKPCYDCPSPTDECWFKSWFDNCTADELLRGEITVEVDSEWTGDACLAHIVSVAPLNQSLPSSSNLTDTTTDTKAENDR